MEEIQPTKIDYKSIIKNLVLVNMDALIERTIEGIIVGYIGDKIGTGQYREWWGYLGFGIITESLMDLVGQTPIANKVASRYSRFSKGRLKESLKDDVGGVVGWAFGNTIGHYIARQYL